MTIAAPVSAAVPGPSDDGPESGGMLVYVGTQGERPDQGIFAARLNPATGALTPLGLAADLLRPTWLVCDPDRPILYSVMERGNDGKSRGKVYSFAINRNSGKLTVLSGVDSGGAGPTYLCYDPRLAMMFVANYGDGRIAAIPVGPDGRLSAVVSTQTQTGSGPNRRQAGPHAHSVVVDPTGTCVLSPDLGTDKVYVYRWDRDARALIPAATPWTAFPPGSGPRHLVFSPGSNLAFVSTELTGEVFVMRWDASSMRLTQLGRVALDAPDFTGKRSASELATSADGRLLYVSNRGANLIQVFTIDPDAGTLTELQRIGCGGQSPWSFAIAPGVRWLIVANQASNNLTVLAIEPQTGKLSATSSAMPVPKPVALAFSL